MRYKSKLLSGNLITYYKITSPIVELRIYKIHLANLSWFLVFILHLYTVLNKYVKLSGRGTSYPLMHSAFPFNLADPVDRYVSLLLYVCVVFRLLNRRAVSQGLQI